MSALSLRLPDDLDTRLAQEASAEGRPRSEVVREAIAEYLTRRERERVLAGMADAARALAQDADARRESLELANDLAGDGLDTAENDETASDDRWWR